MSKKQKTFRNPIKESEYDSNDADLLSMSIDEISDEKSNIQLTYSDEDVKAVDEEIEMERIMKMNFYKFKSQNQNGIIGMCQKIKNKKLPISTMQSHNNSKEYSDKDKYKSFLNKNIEGWANLMLSNVLLSNKSSQGKRDYFNSKPID